MENIIPTAGVLVYDKNKVLLVRHKTNSSHQTDLLGIPSGVIKDGETEKRAALRKFTAETGLETSEQDLVEIPTLYQATIERKDRPKRYSLKVFVAKTFHGMLKEAEVELPEWIEISNLNQNKLLPNVGLAVKEGLKYK